tara:strand:+ start:1531 stop:2754 length:1224 start_codon:yes stop_codon:yes gene_type:complete
MISVKSALERISNSCELLPAETISLENSLGRVLAKDALARRTHPPFPVSAMDGYALRAEDVNKVPVKIKVVGEIPAGKNFPKKINAGEAVRIFTGARVPIGANCIVIQENTSKMSSADYVTVNLTADQGDYIRPAGLDFKNGEKLLHKGDWVNPRSLGLLAAMNIPWLSVVRKPNVAILSNGNEIVLPGEQIGENQIISSNGSALAAAISNFGANSIQIGIADDDPKSIAEAIEASKGADLLITTGGASVGDHDFMKSALELAGFNFEFWKVAIRPGKPIMFGKSYDKIVIGLPGNPVSALICAQIFVLPAIKAMLGVKCHYSREFSSAHLLSPLKANDERQDYLRARLTISEGEFLKVEPFDKQDSSMISNLAQSDCLIIREPNAPSAKIGDLVKVLRLDQPLLTI